MFFATGPYPREQEGRDLEFGHSRPSWIPYLSRQHIIPGFNLSPYTTRAPLACLSISVGRLRLIHVKTLPVGAAARAAKTVGSLRPTPWFRGEETKAQRGGVTSLESHSRSLARLPVQPGLLPAPRGLLTPTSSRPGLTSAALSHRYSHTLPWGPRPSR